MLVVWPPEWGSLIMRQSFFRCPLFLMIFCGTSNVTAQNEQQPVDAENETHRLIRSADARLRLAQSDLEIALDINRRVPGNVSGLELENSGPISS